MKKIIFFCLSFFAIIAGAQAQTETLTLKAVKKGEEPKEVMDAIKQDFPTAIAGDLKMLPGKLYGERWSIALDDNVNGAPIERYQVTIKEAGENYEAVYNKSGKMLSSKLVVNETQLPQEVTAAIAAKYPDWTIIKDQEKITYKEGAVHEAFRIEIQKDKMYRNLFVDNSGKLVKDVLLRRSK